MTKPMKTVDLPSGHVGHAAPKHNPHHTPEPTSTPTPPPVSGTAAVSKVRVMKSPEHSKPVHHKLTPEEQAAGKTPNSGKLKKDGSPVPGQDAAHDAERAAERAAEAAAGDGDVPDVTPEPTATPAPTAF